MRNRAFSSAHGTGFGRNGQLTDRHIEYHRARARGGIGLIVIEATSIDNSPIGAGVSSANLRNIDDSILPLYRQLADAVHAEGTKIFCLLSHSGRNTVMGAQGQPPVAPSPIPMDRTRDIPTRWSARKSLPSSLDLPPRHVGAAMAAWMAWSFPSRTATLYSSFSRLPPTSVRTSTAATQKTGCVWLARYCWQYGRSRPAFHLRYPLQRRGTDRGRLSAGRRNRVRAADGGMGGARFS